MARPCVKLGRSIESACWLRAYPVTLTFAVRRTQGERFNSVRGEPFGRLRTGLADHARTLSDGILVEA